MFTEEFYIGLYAKAQELSDVNDWDLLDVCEPLEEDWDNDTVPGCLTYDDDNPPFSQRH